MQVAKWGNSLAVRLPAAIVEALNLKEGDDIRIHVLGDREFAIERKPTREELLKRLRLPRPAAGRLRVRPRRGQCPVVSSTPASSSIWPPMTHGRRRAQAVVAEGGMISVQVLNEIANVLHRKQGISWPEIKEFLTILRDLLDVCPVTIETH